MFILRRLGEEYHTKVKLYTCFIDIEKALDRITKKVGEREKGNTKSFGLICDESASGIKVSVYSELSEEFKVKGRMHQ